MSGLPDNREGTVAVLTASGRVGGLLATLSSFFRRMGALIDRRRKPERMPDLIRRAPRRSTAQDGSQITPIQQANLRLFRQVATELRTALTMERESGSGFRIVNGYIESDAERARIRAICVPVRRAYLSSDPVSFRRILEIVKTSPRPEIQEHAARFERDFDEVRQDLVATSRFGDRRIPHHEMFEVWIDAQVFHEVAEKVRKYRAVEHELGRAVEGIGLHLAERLTRHVLALDDLVADYLDEARGDVAREPETQ